MSFEARAKLAARQAELVAALTGHGAAPAGFDLHRLQATATALTAKRRRAVARSWRELAEALGAGFAERFGAYAMAHPLPREGGPLADGRAFARWLADAGELPDAARLQVFAVDLRYVATANGLVRRRWPTLRVARLHPRRLIVALRLPWLGERWWNIPGTLGQE